MAASTTGGIQEWRHPALAVPMISTEDWKLRFISQQVPPIIATMSDLSIEIIVKLTQETCALLSFFDSDPTTIALPSLSKVR